MKTRLVVHRYFTILFALMALILPFSLQAQSNIAKVGVVRNNVVVVTNMNDAARVLKGGLSANAVVSDITIDFSPSDNRYYLVGKISNDRVTGKAVRLTPNGPELEAASGPGVVLTCSSLSCNDCTPKVKKSIPDCICHSSSGDTKVECFLVSSLTVNF